MDAFLIRAAEYGLGVVLLGIFFIPIVKYFIKRDQVRECEMMARLDKRELDARDARNAHINDLKSVVVNNTDAVRSLTQTLKNRPCLEDESRVSIDNKLLLKEAQR